MMNTVGSDNLELRLEDDGLNQDHPSVESPETAALSLTRPSPIESVEAQQIEGGSLGLQDLEQTVSETDETASSIPSCEVFGIRGPAKLMTERKNTGGNKKTVKDRKNDKDKDKDKKGSKDKGKKAEISDSLSKTSSAKA